MQILIAAGAVLIIVGAGILARFIKIKNKRKTYEEKIKRMEALDAAISNQAKNSAPHIKTQGRKE